MLCFVNVNFLSSYIKCSAGFEKLQILNSEHFLLLENLLEMNSKAALQYLVMKFMSIQANLTSKIMLLQEAIEYVVIICPVL